jgi:hypothetical protein
MGFMAEFVGLRAKQYAYRQLQVTRHGATWARLKPNGATASTGPR